MAVLTINKNRHQDKECQQRKKEHIIMVDVSVHQKSITTIIPELLITVPIHKEVVCSRIVAFS